MQGPYTAQMGGSTWHIGPRAEFRTIKECRRYAESFGTTADYCTITNRKGEVVGRQRRDADGDGTRWYRAL